MPMRYNKGEWSELYAFIKLLKEGRVHCADENAERIIEQFIPIEKIFREETPGNRIEYYSNVLCGGSKIKLFKNGELIKEFTISDFVPQVNALFDNIFTATPGDGAFEIPTIQPFMENLMVTKVKAISTEKVDMQMQIHDSHTGFSQEVGFSIKSDVGSAPTLLNSGRNTNFRYHIIGLSDDDMNEINSIDKTVTREYIKARFTRLMELSDEIEFDKVIDETYEDNLILIDSMLPRIYGEIILQHYQHIAEGIYDCVELIQCVADDNPLNYRRNDLYAIKFKKLITAAALGMTPGTVWDGQEAATGGYLIIKRDGDVLCYHLYNRNFFEEYLLKNTRFDRPSASRYGYGYVYDIAGEKYIDLNVQIRFKTIG